MFVHPGQVDEVAKKFPELGPYQMVVTRSENKDIMTFHTEVEDPSAPALEELKTKIQGAIKDILRIKGEVVFEPKGSLPEQYKKVDDRRTWD